MGEIADMMLDGSLCEMCGVPLEDDASGFPSYCSEECANDRGMTMVNGYPEPIGTKSNGKKKPRHPQDVISIKITYNGDKVYYATQNDSTFSNAVDIASWLNKYLVGALEIQPRFVHPKVKLEGTDLRLDDPEAKVKA